MWLLNWRMAVHVGDGELTGAESSSIKVFGTERILEVGAPAVRGGRARRGYLVPGSPGALLRGRLEAVGAPGAGQHFRGWGERGAALVRGHGRAGHDAGSAVSVASGVVGALRGAGSVPGPQRGAGDADRAAAGAPSLAPDAVNVPMIRHWVEAMGDHNPVYVSDDAARAVGDDQLIAPPTMLQAWIMRGLRASLLIEEGRAAGVAEQDAAATDAAETEAVAGPGPNERMMSLLDDEGLTSVVATNCEQHYGRPLVVGDRLLVRSVIEAISDPKRTGLGTGRFITTRLDYVAVPTPTFPCGRRRRRRWWGSSRPGSRWPPCASASSSSCPRPRRPARPPRPRPAITQDNAFWFEGAREHRLLIQHCTSCGTLRHPPLPACGVCGSFEWDTVESAGRGTLYSFVVVHYPQVASFEYPLPIGLVELEEGTRLVANLDGVEPTDCDRDGGGGRVRRLRRGAVAARVRAGRPAGGREPDGLHLHRRAAGRVRGGRRALLGPGRRRAGGRGRGHRGPGRPRAVGGPGRAPTCWGWPSPRPTAAPGSG